MLKKFCVKSEKDDRKMNTYLNLKEEFIQFKTFLRKHISLIVFTCIIVFLAYGYEMGHFALTIDEEANWNGIGSDYFLRRIADGRFVLGFLKLFAPRILLPFWSTALFSVIMVLNGCLLAYILQDYIKNRFAQCIMSCIFVACPIHAYYIMFSNMSAETALGYMAVILAVYLTDKALSSEKIRIKYFILPAVLVLFANGIYQAFLTVYILLVCGLKVLQIFQAKDRLQKDSAVQMWKNIGMHILCLTSYTVLYLGISKILQAVLNPSRHYIEGFVQWGEGSAKDSIEWILSRIFNISFSLTGSGGFSQVLFYNICFAAVFVIGLFVCRKGFRFLWTVSTLGMFVSNFLMTVIAGGYMPERTYLTFPLYAGICAAMLIEYFTDKKINIIIGLVCVLVILNQTAVITDLFWAEERQQSEDQMKLSYLVNEIANLAGGYDTEVPVIILNDTKYEPYDGTFGFSYLDLGGRLYGYLDYLGFPYMEGNKEQNEYAEERQKSMPQFPQDGSIIYENGTVIVNLKQNRE